MKFCARILLGFTLSVLAAGLILYLAAYLSFVILRDDFPYLIAIVSVMLSLISLIVGFVATWSWAKRKRINTPPDKPESGVKLAVASVRR